VTGLSDVDDMSKAGLTGLGLALKARTSYEPQEPVGVDLDRDDLSFFPLLYWPMDPREHSLSPRALSKVADYMRNGGTILLDTRDLTLGGVRGSSSSGQQTLRRLLAKLDLPPLEPVPSDHVLTKTFYLLEDFPGRWDGGKCGSRRFSCRLRIRARRVEEIACLPSSSAAMIGPQPGRSTRRDVHLRM